MSVVDLHPEHLLDREIRGELDDGDRRLLEEHLAHCATCRMERRMRADFGLELEKSDLSPDVAGIVESLGRRSNPAIEAGRRAEPPPASRRPGRRTRRLVLLAAAATLSVGTVAFASSEAGRREIATIFGHDQATTTNVDAPPSGGALAARSPVLPSAVRTADPSPTADVPATAVTAEPVASATAPLPVAPAAVEPVDAPARETPARLFEAERQARAHGDRAAVLRLHAQLVGRYPGSREAQVSRMVVARMLLDTGDAAGALDGFDAYLRTGSGALVEDALAGRAEALDRLGRGAEARGAWMALLDRYPGTAYAAHARARIASREN